MTISKSNLQSAYALAKERYAALDVDTEQALARLEKIAISLHCWQGDDVGGFENPGGELSGGIAGLLELQFEASIKKSIAERRPVLPLEEFPIGPVR